LAQGSRSAADQLGCVIAMPYVAYVTCSQCGHDVPAMNLYVVRCMWCGAEIENPDHNPDDHAGGLYEDIPEEEPCDPDAEDDDDVSDGAIGQASSSQDYP